MTSEFSRELSKCSCFDIISVHSDFDELAAQLNQTTIRIRIQLRNYLGIFRLFCYSKNKV